MTKVSNKERLFYISYIIFLIGILINESKYNYIPVALKISHIIQLIGCGLAIIKILLDIYDVFKNKNKFKINYKIIIFYIISCIVILITKSKVIAYLPIFVLASKDIDIEKVLKYTLYTYIFMNLFVMISYICGFIVEIAIERNGIARHSFGWTSANQFMIIIFQIIALYLYLRRKKINIYDFIVSFILLMISYYFTLSRMSLLCSLFLLLLFMIIRYTKISKLFDKLKVLVYIVPFILAFIFIGITIAFPKYGLDKIDDILTGRLFYGKEAIKEYGIKPFGSEIKYYGQRADGELEEHPYNYIDSSYVKVLINYGYFYLVIVFVLLIMLNHYAYKNKDYYLLAIIIAVEIYVAIDSFLVCIELNTWFLYIISSIYTIEIISSKKKKYVKIKN